VTTSDRVIRCRDCEHPLHHRPEKALSGETQMVWADQHDVWVCNETGNEHRPGGTEPGVWIVVEGNPVDGLIFHGIPAFTDHEAATEWAENNCSADWWVAPLQDVE
jgi:hypothetical protein